MVLLGLLFSCGGDDAPTCVARTWYADVDGDGFGRSSDPLSFCQSLPGYVSRGKDCDDQNPDVHPNLPDTCDSADNDCDGDIDEDCVPGDLGYSDFRFAGADRNQALGTALACADLTGDGVDDAVIGAPGDAINGTSAGSTMVFASPLDGRYELDAAVSTIGGRQDGARLGAALAGYADQLAVGAPGMETIYLLSGVLAPIPDLTRGQARLHGTEVGHNVAFLGDVDGDGGEDLGIGGAPATVVSAAVTGDLELPDAGVGLSDGAMVRAGDLDGDGLAEALVWDADRARIYASPLVGGEPDVVIDGAFTAAAGPGDTDGDGDDDLLLGSGGDDTMGTDAGAVFLLTEPMSATALSVATRAYGEASADQLGAALSMVGDIDENGTADLLLAAPQSSLNGLYSGTIYAAAGPFSGTIDLSEVTKYVGEGGSDRAGMTLAGACGFQGESGFLIGAPEADSNGGLKAGMAYGLR